MAIEFIGDNAYAYGTYHSNYDSRAYVERVALVVGAAAYRHVPALPNAANDAADMAASLKSEDFREGVAHFLEKRPARFTGR